MDIAEKLISAVIHIYAVLAPFNSMYVCMYSIGFVHMCICEMFATLTHILERILLFFSA